MVIKASTRHLRISPRKVRLVVDVVRGMNVDKALGQLNFINKRAARPVSKLIESAIANATNTYELDKDNLFIKEIKVDEGMKLKRWMPKAHGRATTIRKRTSHLHVVLGEIKDSGEKKAKKQKLEDPIKLGAEIKKEEKIEKKNGNNKEITEKDLKTEKGNEIIDQRMEGRGGHTKIEGKSGKGFASKIFRRKSG